MWAEVGGEWKSPWRPAGGASAGQKRQHLGLCLYETDTTFCLSFHSPVLSIPCAYRRTWEGLAQSKKLVVSLCLCQAQPGGPR